MNEQVAGEKVLSSEPPRMSWVLTFKCLQCLESAHRRDLVKALSLPAAILWLCLPFMGSGIFESLILKISCNLLGALEDQPRQFRTAICLSASQEINQNPKAFSLFPQASTLETPSALLQLCQKTVGGVKGSLTQIHLSVRKMRGERHEGEPGQLCCQR